MTDIIEFNGHKYKLSGRYYRRWNWSKGKPSNLHRAIWEHHHGAIPAGFNVHHIDGDGTNNDLANLELIEHRAHARQHTVERHANGELQPPGDLARVRAAEWHASAEGIAWHREHGERTWQNRVWHDLQCQECGAAFKSPYPNKTKFCHPNCKMAARRRRLRPLRERVRAGIEL